MAEPDPVLAWPRSVHRAWLWSVVLGYLAAGVGFLLGPGLGIMLAVPATLALLAHPRRPVMFLPAAVIAIGSIFVITMFTLPLFLLGLIWFWAHHRLAGARPAGLMSSLVTIVLWSCATTVTLASDTMDPWLMGAAIVCFAGSVYLGWLLTSPIDVEDRAPIDPVPGQEVRL